MYDEGVMAVEDLPVIDSIDELIAEVLRHQQLGAVIAEAVGRLDVSGAWAADGHVSMAALLRDRGRLAPADAQQLVDTGRFLHGYQVVRKAATEMVWSSAQVRAFARVVTPKRAPVFDAMAESLIGIVAPLSARESRIAAADWAAKADALLGNDTLPRHRQRSLRFSRLEDGTVVGRFVLDDAGAVVFQRAIDIARTWNGDDDPRSREEANGDALVSLASFFAAHHDGAGTPRHRPHVELTRNLLDPSSSLSTEGHHLAEDDTAYLTCDCVLHRVIKAGAAILDYGRSVRSVPTPLFRAVVQRDGGCRFPGCDRPVAWCDAHHIRHWAQGGATSLGNLVLLCSHHHHVVHRQHLDVRLEPDATLHIARPGRPDLTSRPHAPPTIRAA
jgi:hypothetical protein